MLIQNVQILTCADREIPCGFIRIEDGRITAVGDMASCPASADAIDGQGLVACPGFIDAHSHVGLLEEGISEDGANEVGEPISPQLRAVDGINPADSAFASACRAGITTLVIGPGSANPIGGTFCAVKTYGNTMDDMLLKDGVAMKFAFGENPINTGKSGGRAPKTRMATAAMIRAALSSARQYDEALSRGEDVPFDFKAEALRPVLQGKMLVKCHVHRMDDIITAMRIAKEFNLRISLEHATEGHLYPEKLSGLPVSVGPVISDKGKPELIHHRIENAGILSAHGASVAIVADHYENPEALLPLYAALSVRAGMDRHEALCAITKNAAKNCDILDMVGTIEVGKLANICLFDRFPLDFDAKLCRLFAEGQEIAL